MNIGFWWESRMERGDHWETLDIGEGVYLNGF
jgi:hypothetical protein